MIFEYLLVSKTNFLCISGIIISPSWNIFANSLYERFSVDLLISKTSKISSSASENVFPNFALKLSSDFQFLSLKQSLASTIDLTAMLFVFPYPYQRFREYQS